MFLVFWMKPLRIPNQTKVVPSLSVWTKNVDTLCDSLMLAFLKTVDMYLVKGSFDVLGPKNVSRSEEFADVKAKLTITFGVITFGKNVECKKQRSGLVSKEVDQMLLDGRIPPCSCSFSEANRTLLCDQGVRFVFNHKKETVTEVRVRDT